MVNFFRISDAEGEVGIGHGRSDRATKALVMQLGTCAIANKHYVSLCLHSRAYFKDAAL